MIPAHRQRFNNDQFSASKHADLLDTIAERYNYSPPFPISETPVFVPAALHRHLLQACDDIVTVITDETFKERSATAIPSDQVVPGETEHPLFLQLDFGIVRDANGELLPQLIEAQGFPSLYFYQALLESSYRKVYDIPKNFSAYFSGFDVQSYKELLKDHILGGHAPEHVVVMDIEPQKQNTQVDFIATEAELQTPVVCISDLILEDQKLFYVRAGKRIRVKRIYNRVIFDELSRRNDLKRQFNLTEPVEVEWAGHPNWFFRISKHSLPLFQSPYVPDSFYLNELETWPEPLSDYVLKPLYSFAGSGVKLDLSEEDLTAIPDPENYILQKKVKYAPVIETPDEGAKAEIRMMFIWSPSSARPLLVNNLVRLSKGKMVGVRYNQGKTWVGGAIGFFEPLS